MYKLYEYNEKIHIIKIIQNKLHVYQRERTEIYLNIFKFYQNHRNSIKINILNINGSHNYLSSNIQDKIKQKYKTN